MKDYFGYKGKICVVTGAASGMGRATVDMLLDLGAEVYALDVAELNIPNVKFIRTDISDKDSIDKAFESIPSKIDRFFGCAGISGLKHSFAKVMITNFLGNKYMLDTYLGERVVKGGAIAFITSEAGMHWQDFMDEYVAIADADGWDGTVEALNAINPDQYPGPMAYGLSKRAMIYYAWTKLYDFSKKGIRINNLMPGPTQSGLTEDFNKTLFGGGDQGMNTMQNICFLADCRLCLSEEMAACLIFLNSDMASYINGNSLTGDYGSLALTELGAVPASLKVPYLPV